ncbi:MAG TPA: SagB/ThcOx family dehydrogenase [Usitatibacter sp.]|nr:SagB/ThcOx family dehydrogenase [Usitatibacter sp.]
MNGLTEALQAYHERSKHRLDRYAPGPGELDWANQPNPFREFVGAMQVRLPLGADSLATRYHDLRRGRLPAARGFELETVAILFELALGLSAWKSYGAQRWALRCNPSSGNLHPTEGYLLCPKLPGLAAGLYHYQSRDHVLEQRAALDNAQWNEAFAGGGVLVGLSSIYWREAWKYGMRAWRYCQHDCGHAIAALAYAAAALGWQTQRIAFASDEVVAGLMGIDRGADFASAEAEAPDVLLWVGEGDAWPDLARLLGALGKARWTGRANRLSAAQVDWPDIDSIHRATAKSGTFERLDRALEDGAHSSQRIGATPPAPLAPDPALDLSFARIARQRRSAVDFDALTRISAAAFFGMMEAVLIDRERPPWNALGSSAGVHAALMVHRVDGLDPGLYLLVRDPAHLPSLKRSLRSEWLWRHAGPEGLPLFLLLPQDLRAAAKIICCHQAIAAGSCFSLGMLANFELALQEPSRYRDLYWECGMLGQALYLEAEAAGIRATGIGCFFDDEMHALLGISEDSWQSLYHFTAGGARSDARLSSLPPYEFQP